MQSDNCLSKEIWELVTVFRASEIMPKLIYRKFKLQSNPSNPIRLHQCNH